MNVCAKGSWALNGVVLEAMEATVVRPGMPKLSLETTRSVWFQHVRFRILMLLGVFWIPKYEPSFSTSVGAILGSIWGDRTEN